MHQLLSTLVEVLSNLGLRFGHLRQSQRIFARLAREADAVAVQLAGAAAAPGSLDLGTLATRLRDVVSAMHGATVQASGELDHIRDGLLRATDLAGELTGDHEARPPGRRAALKVVGTEDTIEEQLRRAIRDARQGSEPEE